MSCFDLQKLAFLSRYFTWGCNAFHHFAPRPRSMTNNIRVTLAANQIRSKPNTNCKLVIFSRPPGSLLIPFPIICPSRCSMVIGYLKFVLEQSLINTLDVVFSRPIFLNFPRVWSWRVWRGEGWWAHVRGFGTVVGAEGLNSWPLGPKYSKNSALWRKTPKNYSTSCLLLKTQEAQYRR